MHYCRWWKHGAVGGPVKQNSSRLPHPGGIIIKSGYRVINVNGKPKAEHRHVMEDHLGRSLIRGESVHHRNGQRSQNDIANLELWSSTQPSGQRAIDKLRWAREIVALYGEAEQLHLI